MSTPQSPQDAAKALTALAAVLTEADIRPVLPAVQALALTDQRRHFDKRQSPDGVPWRPLRFARPNGGNIPLQNFGALRASVTAKAYPTGVTVGTNLAYAGVHQFGATITPVRGKFLAIPLTLEASRLLSPRRFPRPLHFVRGRRGAALMETVAGRGRGRTRSVAQYALVPRVVVPARPFLGFSQEFVGELTDLFGEVLSAKIDAAMKGL